MVVLDFEVFKHDWCMCGLDLVHQKEITIVNDPEALKAFYDANKNSVLIGYNIRNYDQYILKAILCGLDPKDVNDFIILKKHKGYEYSSLFRKVPLTFFDVMTDKFKGLKQLEGYMGNDIRETTVPFDLDRKLTPAELEQVLYYCRHDVEQTAQVFALRYEEFASQFELVKMFNMPRSALGKTKAQLSAEILGAVRTANRGDELEYTIPDSLKIKKYAPVVEWFKTAVNRTQENLAECGLDLDVNDPEFLKTFYQDKLYYDVAGVQHIFAWGGLHGAREKCHIKGRLINVDVKSYYPSLMIMYSYESRNIRDPEKYADIYRTRLEYKAKKDKRANPLKIVLNSTYGAMKDKFNALYDPRQANNVCVAGQLFLLDLLEHLEISGCCEIVQSNTDGILVHLTGDYDTFKAVCDEWQQRTSMELEFDEFSEIWQRDVNNYVLIDKDGKYKSKGGNIKKLNELDNDLPIVNAALIERMVNGTPSEDTIRNCNDLMMFQKIYKVSSLYLYAEHNGEILNEKTFRVFASTDPYDTPLYKVKQKKNGLSSEKFADCPDNCFIGNDVVKGMPLPKNLNVQWYIDLANKRFEKFIG